VSDFGSSILKCVNSYSSGIVPLDLLNFGTSFQSCCPFIPINKMLMMQKDIPTLGNTSVLCGATIKHNFITLKNETINRADLRNEIELLTIIVFSLLNSVLILSLIRIFFLLEIFIEIKNDIDIPNIIPKNKSPEIRLRDINKIYAEIKVINVSGVLMALISVLSCSIIINNLKGRR
jgi:hypothetical protein